MTELPATIEQPLPLQVMPASGALFQGDGPQGIIKHASEAATALKAVVQKQGLVSKISGKDYPRCEAWTLLGTIVGVFPVLCWSKPVLDGESTQIGWEARVEARTLSGAIVGAAEAQCLRSENNWRNRDDFALRSMAQTRATAKALRMPLGFVMTLAGYEATPAEEMADIRQQSGRQGVFKEPPRPSDMPAEGFSGTCTVIDVKQFQTDKMKNPGWWVTLHDGFSDMVAGTFSKTTAELAKNGIAAERRYHVEIKPGNKPGTWRLEKLEPRDNDTPHAAGQTETGEPPEDIMP